MIGSQFQVAEYLELSDLVQYLTNIINKEEFLNKELGEANLEVMYKCMFALLSHHLKLQRIGEQLAETCLNQQLFSDILFKLEEGTHAAHKPLLMAR